MLIRKAELYDAGAVYALICELEEQALPRLEFENIFASLLKLPEHFLLIGEVDGSSCSFFTFAYRGSTASCR